MSAGGDTILALTHSLTHSGWLVGWLFAFPSLTHTLRCVCVCVFSLLTKVFHLPFSHIDFFSPFLFTCITFISLITQITNIVSCWILEEKMGKDAYGVVEAEKPDSSNGV